MERVIRFDPNELIQWQELSPADRLRQADAAFRLFLAVHRPFAKPSYRGFDTIQEFWAFEKEQDLRY